MCIALCHLFCLQLRQPFMLVDCDPPFGQHGKSLSNCMHFCRFTQRAELEHLRRDLTSYRKHAETMPVQELEGWELRTQFFPQAPHAKITLPYVRIMK